MTNFDDELFKQNIINENHALAMDLIPESFIPVNMLYINGKINNTDLDIFVDTGAQISVMSLSLAKQLGISYLIDHFCEGKLVGVGSKNMVGKIHYIDIEFGNFSLPCGFTIIESNDLKIILGLNSMLSTGCIIDLQNKKMLFKNHEIKFLNY